jgi:hypothetical protein
LVNFPNILPEQKCYSTPDELNLFKFKELQTFSLAALVSSGFVDPCPDWIRNHESKNFPQK